MQISREEHSKEWLKNFSQEAEQETTATLEPVVEEEAYNIDFVEMNEELETLERSRHIQQLSWRQMEEHTSQERN
jgi:hypothetical protein